jgi:hypothetical protein
VTHSDGRSDRKSSSKSPRRVHRKKEKSKKKDLGSFLTDTAPDAPDSDDEDNDLFTMFTWSTETVSQSQVQEEKGRFKDDTALKSSMTMEEKTMLVTELLGQGPSLIPQDKMSPPRPEKESSWTDAVFDPEPNEKVYKLGASLRDTKTHATRKSRSRSGEGSPRGSNSSSGEAVSADTKSKHRTKSLEPTDGPVKAKVKGHKSHTTVENGGEKPSKRSSRSRVEDNEKDASSAVKQRRSKSVDPFDELNHEGKLSAPKQRRCKSVDPFDELSSSRNSSRLDDAQRSNSVDPAFDPSFFAPQMKRNKSVELYDQFLGTANETEPSFRTMTIKDAYSASFRMPPVRSKSQDMGDDDRSNTKFSYTTPMSNQNQSFRMPPVRSKSQDMGDDDRSNTKFSYTTPMSNQNQSFRMPPVRSKSQDMGDDDRSNTKFNYTTPMSHQNQSFRMPRARAKSQDMGDYESSMLSHRNQSDVVVEEKKSSQSSRHLLKSSEGRKLSRSTSPKLESSRFGKLKSSSASQSTPAMRSETNSLYDRFRSRATFDPFLTKSSRSRSSDSFEERVSSAVARKQDKKKDKKLRYDEDDDDDDEFMPNMMTVDLRDLLGVAMMEEETPVASNRPLHSTRGQSYDFESIYEDDFCGGQEVERMPAW